MNGDTSEKYSPSKKGEGKITCRVSETPIAIIRRLMEENILSLTNTANMRVFEHSVSAARTGTRYT